MEQPPSSDRRSFLQKVAVAGAGIAAFTREAAAQNTEWTTPENVAAKGEVPRRKFGKTGIEVSLLGVGGHTFAEAKTDEESIRIIHEAIDAGVTFMDNAWEYHDGRSEKLMGRALSDGGRRDKVFLMTKVCTHGRSKEVAMAQLEESLKRLKTDHIDLWQIHEVAYENDPELHFAKGGVAEALLEAKKQGKVRFLGFTGHKHPDLHLKMLSHDFPFDSCQLPLCGFDAGFRSFQKQVLPVLLQKGIAPIGMKSLNGDARAIKEGIVRAEDAIRYAMSLPVATVVSGMDSVALLRENIRIAKAFTPMSKEERLAFEKQCAAPGADGRFELYKTSIEFDGPPGREQHGFPSKKEVAA